MMTHKIAATIIKAMRELGAVRLGNRDLAYGMYVLPFVIDDTRTVHLVTFAVSRRRHTTPPSLAARYIKRLAMRAERLAADYIGYIYATTYVAIFPRVAKPWSRVPAKGTAEVVTDYDRLDYAFRVLYSFYHTRCTNATDGVRGAVCKVMGRLEHVLYKYFGVTIY